MGLWGAFSKIVSTEYKKLQEPSKDAEQKYRWFYIFSDEELISIYKTGNSSDKTAASRHLKERGVFR